MKASLKCWIIIFPLVLCGCGPLPLNGIVTITPAPVPSQAIPAAVPTFTVLPSTLTAQVLISPTLPLPITTTPAITQLPPLASTPKSTILQGIVETARLDLSKRLSIPVSEITLTEVSEVSWADLSLGCPQPGMMYGQMVTTGYLVIFSAGNTRYDYHAGPDRSPFYCEKPQAPIPGNSSGVQ